MRPLPEQNRGKAILASTGAIALANLQDAIVKGVSADIPAYETLIIRCVFAFPILFGWLIWSGNGQNLFATHSKELALRSLVLCSAYFSYILSIVAMPLATAVSIYFTMPFFVAGLSGVFLSEKVPAYRWVATLTGFCGILISVRPSIDDLRPAIFFGLYSAFAYAIAQMWGRRLSHRVSPVVILNWQNFTNLAVASVCAVLVLAMGSHGMQDKSLDFLVRPMALPTQTQFGLLAFMGVCSAFVATLFLFAYRMAEANFIAPFEYSAILWAALYGTLIFHDNRDALDWVGTAIVICAGLCMVLIDRRRGQSTG